MNAPLTLGPSAARPGEPAPFLPGIEPEPPGRPAQPLVLDDDEPAEFDWMRDEAIIVEQQRSIAVYRNPRDAVVVRADGDGYADDAFIILSTDHALKALIAALQREAKRGVR